MEIDKRLGVAIEEDMKYLEGLTPGTDEYLKAAKGIGELVDRAVELKKSDIEAKVQLEKQKAEKELREKEMEEERKDRLIKNCIAAAGVVLPICVTVWGTLKSFEFEREGTITTIMGRGFINKLLPKK